MIKIEYKIDKMPPLNLWNYNRAWQWHLLLQEALWKQQQQ